MAPNTFYFAFLSLSIRLVLVKYLCTGLLIGIIKPALFVTKRSGRLRSVHTKKAIKAVRVRIRRNRVRKQKILSREMKIAPKTMSRILKDDLGLAAYNRRTGHFLTDNLKKNRVVK